VRLDDEQVEQGGKTTVGVGLISVGKGGQMWGSSRKARKLLNLGSSTHLYGMRLTAALFV